MNTDNNCKKVINRMVVAYNAKTIKELSKFLNTTVSVIGNRVARNTIPYDLIVKCSIDTGANLEWLIEGKGSLEIDKSKFKNTQIELPDDIIEKLERLGNLRKDNVITDDEFNILKVNLIK